MDDLDHDYPDFETDDYIGDDYHGYHAIHDGRSLGSFPSFNRAVAALYLARESDSYWPNVWYVNERGNTTLCVFDGHNLRFTDTAYV